MALHFFQPPPGTAAPPASYAGYTFTPFPLSGVANGTLVNSVASPLGGTIDFSMSIYKTKVGVGWATWSHGYTGDVYFRTHLTPPTLSDITITLPADTGAFYLYLEPDSFAVWLMKVTANDGTTSGNTPVDGISGATIFGFYADPGESITSVRAIIVPGPGAPDDFAIGEFGIAPATTSEGGSITISKTTSVEDPTAEFTILFGTGETTLETFTLKGGESATFGGLDPELTYWAEESVPTGWEQTGVVVSDGTVTAIIVTEGDTTTVEFQNAPTPFVGPTETQRRLIRRMRRSPHVANQGQWSFISNFELWMTTGVGLSGDAQGSDPQIQLRVSKDGGQTWGQSRTMSVGQLGAYRQRVIWWQLGQARDWVFEVTCSDPVAWSLVQAYIDIEPGVS